MAEGIKDRVAIIGMGCTQFGERWDKGPSDLMIEAFIEAIEDAGIEKKDIGAAWSGTCYEEVSVGKSAIPIAATLKLPFRLMSIRINFQPWFVSASMWGRAVRGLAGQPY